MGESVMKNTLSLLSEVTKPLRPKIAMLLLLTAMLASASAAPAYLMRSIIDGAMARHEVSLLFVAVSAMLVNAIIFALIGYAQGSLNVRLSQAISRHLRLQIADRIYRVPLAFVSQTTFGSLMTRLSNDVDGLEGLFSGALVQGLSSGMQLAIGVALVFEFSWQLGLVALVVVPSCTLPMIGLGRQIYSARIAGRVLKDRFNTIVAETLSISGLTFIKSNVIYRSELDRLKTVNQELQAIEYRSSQIGLKYSLFNSVTTMATPALMWLIGYWLVQAHAITLGALLASITLFLRLFIPAGSLAGLQVQLTGASALVTRLREILDMPCETDEPLPAEDAIAKRNGSVVLFENVAIAFSNQPRILDSATFQVEPGETVALCGASGAGKTTVAKALLRFIELEAGVIRLNGVDVREIDLHELRRSIAVIAQEPFLLNDTIAANVAIGSPRTSFAEIVEACRLAGATEFIEAAPEQYNTVVGDRGMRLSGGQRQRLAIARLFLRKPSVIVLDEATSALDVESECAILMALKDSFPHCATVVITHRQSTLAHASRIINLRDGRVENGRLLDVA